MGLGSASAADWNLVKYDGRDYVTFADMAGFYGLTGIQRVANTGTLSLGTRSLRGQSGSVEFYINNLKFNLSYPVIDHAGQLCVSRMDLVKVIEPVLRPSKIKGGDSIDTVVLDPGHGGYDHRRHAAPAATRKPTRSMWPIARACSSSPPGSRSS